MEEPSRVYVFLVTFGFGVLVGMTLVAAKIGPAGSWKVGAVGAMVASACCAFAWSKTTE